jgi:predicted molibdopterin-dependent oxidoreductase YjgC
VSLLTDPAPRLPGVASTLPSSESGASRTGTQSSTSGEEVQSQDSCARCQARSRSPLHVQDNRIVKVTSPLDHDVTHGHLCVKGRFGFKFVQRRAKES